MYSHYSDINMTEVNKGTAVAETPTSVSHMAGENAAGVDKIIGTSYNIV